MIIRLKANSSTITIWRNKPQIFNQLGDTTTISHALRNSICSFPTLFQPDFVTLNKEWQTKAAILDFDRGIFVKNTMVRKYSQNAISAILTAWSFAHARKMEQVVNLSLGRSSVIILKFSLSQFNLQKYPWNNVGLCRTKISARFLHLCGCAVVACMWPLWGDVTKPH